MRFNPQTSVLAGMDTSVLQARLAQMQQDYLDLMSGAKVVSASYTQGEGGKSVTYDRTNIAQLTMAIRQLQAQLGIIRSPRRAIGVRF
ncbi:gpW family head-tail joining protein [Novosphingobium humi]|uniref:GpW family head-tail joining protein n=1 Tax=Novosphingobium humi TaxID=2282397 RepID=A0ABY7U2S8_9SPHN|nr:gpW family head-tail joining protein [Novosphingobium humi]WCT78659.1 gpW family head-tail joining protein [Novosphingobium humi]